MPAITPQSIIGGGGGGTSARSKTIIAHLAASGSDLVGPPDTYSNLRPIQYAAHFAAPQPISSTRKLHPYSLEEFSSSSHCRDDKVMTKTVRRRNYNSRNRLEELRQRFEAEDLAWRLQRRRLDQISHEHWTRSNLAFSASRDEAEEAAKERVALSSLTKSNYKGGEIQKHDPEAMEQFLRDWVESRASDYERYQQQWIAGIVSHIRPAMRAVYRDWRWKFEVWRCY